ncbi:prenylcysteine oxidase-like [Brachionus plicatilis]|uniref:Prenylcysteine oxidase-like n=1 Tax=Brachionus plicatilis TaxID=10195 RepID=A0A3M7QB50_BRAPC|nr:prenylcysteine oxidase-like [Brachionus plicatilis]
MNASSDVTNSKKIKIAIVGSGISGAANAYFLRQTFCDNVELVMFEKADKIGGRLATFEFNGRLYELGGSVLHPSNNYMHEFLEKLDLEKKDKENSSKEALGLFDGKGLLLKSSGRAFGLVDKINFIQHFGFFQLFKFKKWLRSFINDFSKIYGLQDKGFVFTNFEEFLTKINPELYKASQKSLEATLREQKFNDRIINQLASIACLTNYGQSIEIDGFVGSVSLAGLVDDLWAVKTGNRSVAKKLIEKSSVELKLNTQVKGIYQDPSESDKNLIVFETEDKNEIRDNSFDYVIIAFPLYKDVFQNHFKIEFEIEDLKNLEMQITNTYIIFGEQILFTKMPSNKRINLHCTDPSLPYRSICVQLPCDYCITKDRNLYMDSPEKLYKIFSDQRLDEKDFDKIFKQGYQVIEKIPWKAYPKYVKNPAIKTIPRIVLDKARSRVFYSNSMEWSSSCMEISCISSRNVVNMIATKENVKIKPFFTKSKQIINVHSICKISSIVLIAAFLYSSYYKL